MTLNYWRPDEDRILLDARDNQRRSYGSISAQLTGRSAAACVRRYQLLKCGSKTATRCDLVDVKRADQAAEPTTITGVLLGDPPPGRSALDQRRIARPGETADCNNNHHEGPRVTLATRA